jgi:hypothetical protein
MNLKGIISISGKAGLYKVVAQGKNNIIVESLEDKKRFPAYSSDRISALEDISIYTYDEDVVLRDILTKIFEKEEGKTCISHKEDKAKLEAYLTEILPNYDKERVYISDVKKIFQWYNLLHKSGDLTKEEETENTDNIEEVASSKKVAKAKTEKTDVESNVDGDKTKKVVKPKTTKTAAKPKTSTPKAATKTSAPKKVTAVKTGVSRGK